MGKKLIRISLVVINVLAVIWLLLCMYGAYHNPSSKASFISLLCFSLPFAIIVNLAFIILWILFTKRRKWMGILSFLALAASWPVSGNVFSFHPFSRSGKKSSDSTVIKLMTYNVHLFDLGGWTKDKSTQRRILDFIKEENPDIMCLQEFYFHSNDNKEPFTEAISSLGYPYFQFIEVSTYPKRRITSAADKNEYLHAGIAVFSKYPIDGKKEYSLGNSGTYKAASMLVKVSDKQKFTLLTTHLQSTRIGDKDRSFIDEVKQKQDIKALESSKVKNIVSKLSETARLRAIQANRIDEIKRSLDQPLIICGDFNDVPGSYTYQTIKEGMSDPFTRKGFGLGRTFSSIFRTLRIDHILYDKESWEPISYHVVKQNLSDHYPVIAEMILKK